MSVTLLVAPDKVAAYIRWSTDEQSDGTTLEVQREACRHYIAAQGWDWREELVFIDDGYSGGSLGRPGLGRLRAAIAAGQVQCVVVFKLDRLSRSVLDTVKLVLEEWNGRCHIKSAREPVDTSSPNGKMFFYMLASYAEWERNVIRERTMSGKISRARQGKNPGMVHPYGYQRGDAAGSWAVLEPEAAIVRRIFREYLAGATFRDIAVRLNSDGIRPRRGREWHVGVIKQIVANPIYTGTLYYGKNRVAEGESKHKRAARVQAAVPQAPGGLLARVDGAVPPLISLADFARAQEIRAGRALVVGKRAIVSEFLLTGIIRCRCGALMDGHTDTRRRLRYYRCTSHKNRRATCTCGLVPAARVEEEVLNRVRAVYDPAHRAELLRGYEKDLEREGQQAAERLRGVEAALAQLVQRRQRLDAAFDAGDLPAKLYARRHDELEVEESRLEASRVEAEASLARLRAARVDLAAIDAVVAQINAWDELTVPQRKELLRWAVQDLTAYRSKAESPGRRARLPVELEAAIRRPAGVPVGARGPRGAPSQCGG